MKKFIVMLFAAMALFASCGRVGGRPSQDEAVDTTLVAVDSTLNVVEDTLVAE